MNINEKISGKIDEALDGIDETIDKYINVMKKELREELIFFHKELMEELRRDVDEIFKFRNKS